MNRQFDWIEISTVYNKSDKHISIYDSNNVELAARKITSVKLFNFTEVYSLTNEKKFHVDNLTKKYLLYKQFVAWSYNGSSFAPLTDCINKPIYQELIDKDDYFNSRSDERIYLDLRASSGYTSTAKKLERNDSKINFHLLLKAAASKKLRVRVWANSIGEYLYILSRSGLTLKHWTYTINQEDEDLLEWQGGKNP